MSISIIIAGLGNPGQKYNNTRHNIGFEVVNELASRHHVTWNQKKWEAELTTLKIGKESVLLIKPQTFMNLSGKSVQPALSHYKLPEKKLIVVHDEIDLDFGDLKFKDGGGHRGHNGLRDIKARLGTGEFFRLRLGVGRPQNEHMSVADYVLGKFTNDELSSLPSKIQMAVDSIEEKIQSM